MQCQLAGIATYRARVINISRRQSAGECPRRPNPNLSPISGWGRGEGNYVRSWDNIRTLRRAGISSFVGLYKGVGGLRAIQRNIKMRRINFASPFQQNNCFVGKSQRPGIAPNSIRVRQQPALDGVVAADEVIAGADFQIAARAVFPVQRSRRATGYTLNSDSPLSCIS